MFTKFTRYILPLERFREKRERDTTKKVKGKGRKRKYPWIQNTTRKEDLKSESEGKSRSEFTTALIQSFTFQRGSTPHTPPWLLLDAPIARSEIFHFPFTGFTEGKEEEERRARRNYDRFAGPICMRRVISDSDCRISSFMSMQVTRALATSII